MAPAFHSNRSAAAFALFLILLISLPALLGRLGLTSRKELYKAISPTFGANSAIEQTIFAGPLQSDVVILGSSPAICAFPPGALDKYLGSELRRKAVVEYLILQRSGPDKLFLMLKDYLSTHDTKLIVAELPWRTYASYGPSVDLNTLLRFGELQGDLAELTPADRLRIYSEQTVSAPRQLLNDLRPNGSFVGPYDDVDRSEKRGMDGPFNPDHATAPAGLARSCIIPISSRRIKVVEPNPTNDYYNALFYTKICSLAKSRGIAIIFASFPEFGDYGTPDIPINLSLTSTFDSGQKLLAVSAADLFGNMSKARFRNFFRDDVHLNANGAQLFDDVAFPAICREYEKAAQDHE